MLGEFEYLLLASAVRLKDEAYGAAIRQDLERRTERNCSIGALYTTLDRMEEKGLIETWMGEATAQRGGRAKRRVRVTAKGAAEAAEFYNAISAVSLRLPWTVKRRPALR